MGMYDKVFSFFNIISGFLDKMCRLIVVVVGTVMTACLIWGVFTRFILKSPAIFTEEVARFCLVWLAFIGSSIAMKKKDLTSFRFVVDRLPLKGQKFMEILGTVLLMVYLVIFLKSGNDAMAIFERTKASVTKLPLIYPAMGLYIGAGVMLIHAVPQLMEQIKAIIPAKGGRKEQAV